MTTDIQYTLEPFVLKQLEDFSNFEFNFDDKERKTNEGGGNLRENQQLVKKIQELKIDKNESSWLFEICQNFINTNETVLSAFDLSKEILGIYKQAQHQRHSEEYMQDKIFQLLGENCFELLSEILTNLSQFKKINVNDLSQAEKNQAQQIEQEMMNSSQNNQVSNNINSTSNFSVKRNANVDWLAQLGFSEEYLQSERALGLQKNENIFNNNPYESEIDNVNHWTDNLLSEGSIQYYEKKGLPPGSEKKVGPGYEEVFIPANKNNIITPPGGFIQIKTAFEPWAQLAFEGIKELNTIQSLVFNTAFNTPENLLICAPTGAGKTNIAMLAFLQHVQEHVSVYSGQGGENSGFAMDRSRIKAVYIAPMKALAQEVVAKFSARLKPLGLKVRECTGDMQLTRQEISDSNLIVLTPEKYDVISRKGGEGSLSHLTSLIIIDEVHLLADERGAVIETIVARTQRFIETSQKFIRIVGLSATLPNYLDVAKFLRVNIRKGLFFFDSQYRPVPLSQTFIGISEKNKTKKNNIMIKHAYDKLVQALEKNKQVMIFVHSRKDTSKTANAILDLANEHGTIGLFDTSTDPQYNLWRKEVEDRSRGEEVRQLFLRGAGIHHAGMTRRDRGLTEELFEKGLIRFLCCTATLAWGVNLPAHTVIIKGTELYDPERGGYVDLSILDIFQIFGRAGRPQYDNSGSAILITPLTSLDHYLGLLSVQVPIESSLVASLADHLNAEVVAGTVSNIREAISWLTYTFLYVRMCLSPLPYGASWEELRDDPTMAKRREKLCVGAAQTLDRCMMLRYDARSGNLGSTDLGRVASHFYIKHASIEAFNSMLAPHLSLSDALHVLCSASEFDQLKLRPEETEEIQDIKHKYSNIKVKAPLEDTAGKVSVLLQGYLSQARLNSFTLQSDSNYVAQNASRISRALFELCLKRGWASMAVCYLELSKCIERRIKLDQTPIRQFFNLNGFNSLNSFSKDELPTPDILNRLEELNRKGITLDKMKDMKVNEINEMLKISHSKSGIGKTISYLIHSIPKLDAQVVVQPISQGIIKLIIKLIPLFHFNNKFHHLAESFWILIEDSDREYIYHAENIQFKRNNNNSGNSSGGGDNSYNIEIVIPIRLPIPPQYWLRIVSDHWLGGDHTVAINFKHLVMPDFFKQPHTKLLNLNPLPLSALKNAKFEAIYRKKFAYFNPIQSQVFHELYNSDNNILIGAPTGSGKTLLAELAILRLLATTPSAKVVYVAPLKALARERVVDWRKRFGNHLGIKILELTGDSSSSSSFSGNERDGSDAGSERGSERGGEVSYMRELNEANLLVVTPEKWDSVSRGWRHRGFVRSVGLVVLDEVHLLGAERGAVLEALVSRMRVVAAQTRRSLRLVALSTALANPADLAHWLGIGSVSGNLGEAELNTGVSTGVGPGSDVNTGANPGAGGGFRLSELSGLRDLHASSVSSRGVFNFHPSVRPVPMQIHISGFPGQHYCPRMASMNKAVYAAVMEHSPDKPALVFVASRRQTRLTALDLIARCAADDDSRRFLGKTATAQEMEELAQTVSDESLRLTLPFGIALHHAGLSSSDRELVEELFLYNKILLMVATATLAWGVNLPAHLVVVKGTEFFDCKQSKYVPFEITDVLQMVGRAGRPQFDDSAVACVFVHEPLKNFYRKFLFEPFPVESSLHKHLHEHINAEIAGGILMNVEDCMEYLKWTYYYRRLIKNPSYYQLDDASTQESVDKHLRHLVSNVLFDLRRYGCIKINSHHKTNFVSNSNDALDDKTEIVSTELGKITSYYYLNYQTVDVFVNGLKTIIDENLSKNNYNNDDENDYNDIDNGDNENVQKSKGKKKSRSKKPVSVVEKYLRLVSDAPEFSEVPVRHNEDLLNEELSLTLPWKPRPNSLGESNTKAFLLLQAHLKPVPLPALDYKIDQRSVVDQLPRVINALIDVAVQLGFLDSVCSLIRLSQLFYQGLFEDSSELLQLPGISPTHVSQLLGREIVKLRDILVLSNSKLDNVARSLDNKVNKKETEKETENETEKNKFSTSEFSRIVKELPLYEASLKLKVTGNSESSESSDPKESNNNKELSESESWANIAFEPGTDICALTRPSLQPAVAISSKAVSEIELTLSRIHGYGSGRGEFCGSRNTKPKALGWFVVVGSLSSGKLLSLTRAGEVGGELVTSLFFQVARNIVSNDIVVFAACDSIRGLDVTCTFSVQSE